MPPNELFGDFWIRRRARRYGGRLILDEDRFSLELDENPRPTEPPGYEIDVLHGTSRGYPMSLFNCQETRRAAVSGDPFPERIDVGAVLLGAHVSSARNRLFREAVVRVHGLPDFVGFSGLSLTTPSADRQAAGTYVVEWEPPEEPAAQIRGVSIRFRSRPDFEYASHYEFRLRHSVSVTFTAPKRKSLDEWREKWIDGMSSLVALGVDEPAPVEQMVFREAAGSGQIEYFTRARSSYAPRYARQPYDPVFLSLADLGPNRAAAIQGFYSFREAYREPAELLFEYQILAGALTPPDRFLYLARFMESFHRMKHPAPKKKEPGFRKRLERLLANEARAAQPFFGGSSAHLASRIVDTRNYYVHYNAAGRARALHGIELDDLADKAWFIVRACVLSEMGLPSASIEEALRRDPLEGVVRASILPSR